MEIRETLSVTVSFDHDIVDGAPAARFVQHLRALVEAGPSLETAPGPTPSGYVQGKAPPVSLETSNQPATAPRDRLMIG